MNFTIRNNWILLLMLVPILAGCSQTPSEQVDITEHFRFTSLAGSQLTPREILTGKADDFLKPLDALPLFGDAVSRYWFMADITENELPAGSRVIELTYPLFDRVDFWITDGNDRSMHYRAGALYAFSDRVIRVPEIVFPMEPGGKDTAMAFSIQTSTPLLFRVFLWPRSQWEEHQRNLRLWYGALAGGIAILVIYNLILTLALRDTSYLYYAGYLISVNLMNLVHAGYLDALVWPETAGVSARIVLILVSSSIILVMLFVNRFLDVRMRFPKWWRLSLILSALVLPAAFTEPLGLSEWNQVAIPYLLVFSHFSMWYAIAVSIRGYLSGLRQARFAILGLSLFYICVLLYELYILQLVAYNRWLPHVLEIGSLAEGLVLSLALADRIRMLRRNADNARQKLMDTQTALSKQIIHKEEQFRQWSSGILHDVIANGLLLIKLNLDSLSKKIPPTEAGESLARQIEEQVAACDSLIHEVRRLSHDLHPHLLTRLGFKAATEAFLKQALSPQDIHFHANIPDDIDRHLDNEYGITLYRSIQECISNILKHAHAKTITLDMHIHKERICVRIQDDGKGFDPESGTHEGIGLLTIQGRLALFGGDMDIRSKPGAGTLVTFSLPLAGGETT